jgi:glutathionylspermidine synthase
MQTDSEFADAYGELPVLETYVTPDVFKARGEMYVSKPLIGRLSNNIVIHGDGEVKFDSKGSYEGYEVIYQAYHEPHKVEGRNNFILGMWMAPIVEQETHSHDLMAEPVTMAIREFDEPVLSIGNERFIPHLVELGE